MHSKYYCFSLEEVIKTLRELPVDVELDVPELWSDPEWAETVTCICNLAADLLQLQLVNNTLSTVGTLEFNGKQYLIIDKHNVTSSMVSVQNKNDMPSWDIISARLDKFRDGTTKTEQLLNTVKRIVDRYIFLVAYIAVNRDVPDFAQLLMEAVEGEECWDRDTDPDILAFFEETRSNEEDHARRRVQKEAM